MNNLKDRWNTPTPKFWKRIQAIGITIGSVGLILVAPPIGLAVAGGYLITAGSIIGVLSQLTVKDNGIK
jgi:uncharacterized membrane protein